MKSRVIQHEHDRSAARPVDVPAVSGGPGPARRGPLRSLIGRHPLTAFFVIAFALTWVTVPFGTFMAAGPLLGALIVLGVTEGKTGIRRLGRRMVQWRVRWPYYVAAVTVPLAVGLAAGGTNVALGASDGAFANLEVSALLMLFALRLVVPVFAPIGEEPGWRGFALPTMQRVRTPFAATLLLGVVVAAWHVPLLAISEEKFEPVLLLGTVFVTFWYTWLFDRTRGSVFITVVAHAADGLVGAKLLADDGGFHGSNADRFLALYSAAWLIVAVVLVVADRRRFFSPVTDTALVEPAGPATRTRWRATVTAVVAVLATAGVVGLAGTAAAKTVDRDSYIERADAICSMTVDDVDAIIEDVGLDPSDEDARAAGRKVLALGRVELEELRALPAPPKDSARIATIYEAMDRGWDKVDARPSRIFDEPGPFARARKLASAYGLEVCGRG
jgi:membrane protease YdiL (CAAX protease family)